MQTRDIDALFPQQNKLLVGAESVPGFLQDPRRRGPLLGLQLAACKRNGVAEVGTEAINRVLLGEETDECILRVDHFSHLGGEGFNLSRGFLAQEASLTEGVKKIQNRSYALFIPSVKAPSLSPLSLPFSGNQREHKPKRGRDAGQARLATPRYSLPDKVGGRPAFALLLSKHERGKLLALFLERQGRGCSSITALLLTVPMLMRT